MLSTLDSPANTASAAANMVGPTAAADTGLLDIMHSMLVAAHNRTPLYPGSSPERRVHVRAHCSAVFAALLLL